MEKIDSFSLKKGIVVYGKMRVMYIEKDYKSSDNAELFNEEKDKFIIRKNQLGNTEVYLNEELKSDSKTR